MESMVTKAYLTNAFQHKKIFITGHTGFKGSWLSLWLTALGAVIKGYALSPENNNCIFNVTQPYKDSESVIADIRNKEILKNEIKKFDPDFIFHLAAQPLVRKSYEIPAETFMINAVGTANVLEAVSRLSKKCTIIIITTDKVYHNKEQDVFYNEKDELGGFDAYSASKACTELVVSSFRNCFFNTTEYSKHQKSIASVRAGNVIGGGDYSIDRIIPDIIRSLEDCKEIIVRNPFAVRPWQHVLEPLGGYLLLAARLNENIHFSGAYNFGPNPNDHLTVKDLVNTAIQVWGDGSWKTAIQEQAPHESHLLKLDISKAKQVLGWHPKLQAQQAIEWTLDWYKKPVKDLSAFSIQQINNYMLL